MTLKSLCYILNTDGDYQEEFEEELEKIYNEKIPDHVRSEYTYIKFIYFIVRQHFKSRQL